MDTVFVAGQVKKWAGQLVGSDILRLKQELEASRDFLFEAAGAEKNPFGQYPN